MNEFITVPREPTEAMVAAGDDCYGVARGTESWVIGGCKGSEKIWAAMVAAAELAWHWSDCAVHGDEFGIVGECNCGGNAPDPATTPIKSGPAGAMSTETLIARLAAAPKESPNREALIAARDGLLREAVHMEQDWPGDVAVDCGWWCRLCNDHVKGDRKTGPSAAGHEPHCPIAKIETALSLLSGEETIPAGNWVTEVFKPLPADEVAILRDIIGDPDEPPTPIEGGEAEGRARELLAAVREVLACLGSPDGYLPDIGLPKTRRLQKAFAAYEEHPSHV